MSHWCTLVSTFDSSSGTILVQDRDCKVIGFQKDIDVRGKDRPVIDMFSVLPYTTVLMKYGFNTRTKFKYAGRTFEMGKKDCWTVDQQWKCTKQYLC